MYRNSREENWGAGELEYLIYLGFGLMNAKKLLLIYEDRGRGIADSLVNRGFRAIVSDDGFKALEKFKRLPFAGVVVVIKHNRNMEAMDFIFNIREEKKKTPIIIIDNTDESDLNLNVLNAKNIFVVRESNQRLADKVADIIAEHRAD